MLHYLRIFAWFLLTFGVVGFLMANAGVDIGIGVGRPVAVLMAFQVAVGAVVLLGFKMVRDGKLHPQVLSVGAIALILFYVVAGQVWIAISEPARSSAMSETQVR